MNYVKSQPVEISETVFRNAKIGKCFYCSQIDKTYDIKAAGPQYRACKRCIKSQGLEMLRRGADSALALIEKLSNKTCRHCGEPVIQPARGFAPLICSACEEEWRCLAQQV